ncbi:hypothetical protein E1B28_010276 [Marasmius oreades]|uniref:mitogen-activated protein kinase kinase kinase n=1 Tax=Marasmius oreades TaxID=181124 RepID=A0A9P7RXG2_9AGAR|nr:uncharacterized protein E1B28_010276 [Marasmius oreades]KAG7091225.1 hypothetical protein E1B28_010276 [Marasmius oreades]
MASTVAAQPRCVIQPKYEFDPNAAYADPEVQAWAAYYAHGGTDPAGTIHFISVPGLKTTDGGQKNHKDHISSVMQSRPSLTIDTDFPGPSTPIPRSVRADSDDLQHLRTTYGIVECHPVNDVTVKCNFNPTGVDELAVNGGAVVCVIHQFHDQWSFVKDREGKRGMVPSEYLQLEESSEILRLPWPRTPSSMSRLNPVRSPDSAEPPQQLPVFTLRSKRKSKRSILGLLELLHFSKRKQGDSSNSKTSLPPITTPFNLDLDRRPRSALKKSLSLKGKQKETPELQRRVRFDSALNERFLYESTSDIASIISPSVSQFSDDSVVETPLSMQLSDSESGSNNPSFTGSLPPSYDELFSLFRRPLPDIPTEISHFPPLSFGDIKEQQTSLTLDSKSHGEGNVPVEVHVKPVSPSMDSLDPSIVRPEAVVCIPVFLPEDIASETIIYRNILSLLVKEVSSTDTLRTTLHEYIVTLRPLDRVSSLLQSRDYRANLLQVASALDISEDARIREALQKDEHEIAGLLDAISHSEVSKAAVLRLEGEDAQKFLDVVQDVLDKAYLLNQDDNARARRLLVKLSETCDKLPLSLFIKGVERADEQATFGGGFGDVYRASYNGQYVALKRMRIFSRDPGLPNIRRRFCKEALIWQQLKSSFVVPFLGIDAETFPSFLCMVSPWMRHGTVLKHLADHGRNGVDKRLYEVAQGLSYLHSQKIAHGDLRGSNILINDEWQACLTDFGLTVFDDATALTFTSRREGSVRWMAPELHDPESFGLDRFRLTPETDIYAFGCVCLELYTGRPPFVDILRDPAVIFKVIQGGRPSRPMGEGGMSDQLWKVVEMCWSQHFADRLKTEEVVEFTKRLSDPDTKFLDLPVFSEVPQSLLLSNEDEDDDGSLDMNAEEDTLVKKSLANALYLQGELSISNDSLFTQSLHLFPNIPGGPFPTDSPIVYTLDEEDEEDEEDDVDGPSISVVDMEVTRFPPVLPLRKSSLSMLSITPASRSVTPDLPEVLNDYWSIVDQLDSALDNDFSLTLDFEPAEAGKAGDPSPTPRSATAENIDLKAETCNEVTQRPFSRSTILDLLLLAVLASAFVVSMSSLT